MILKGRFIKLLAKICLAFFVFFSAFFGFNFVGSWLFLLWYNSPRKIAEKTLQDDPVFHHKWIPNKHFSSSARGSRVDFWINCAGFPMKKETALRPEPGTTRIFLIGDSNTAGVVDECSKWSVLLEAGLCKIFPSQSFEVINSGVSSWSFVQYFFMSRVALEYKPKILIVGIDMTDLSNDAYYQTFLKRNSSGEPEAVTPLHSDKILLATTGTYTIPHSFAERPFFLLDFFLWRRSQNSLYQDSSNQVDWFRPKWNEKTEQQFYFSMSLISKIQQECARRGIFLVVTAFPHARNFQEHRESPLGRIQEWMKQNNIYYVDLHTKILSLQGNPLEIFWKNDPTHFNEAGNRLISEVILDFFDSHRELLAP